MADSVYKVIELVGTSPQSWEKAASSAVKLASQSLRDLRVAEISELDMHIVDGKVAAYRARVKVSFKYESGSGAGEKAAPAAKVAAKRAKKAPKAAAEAPEAAPAKKAPRRKGKR